MTWQCASMQCWGHCKGQQELVPEFKGTQQKKSEGNACCITNQLCSLLGLNLYCKSCKVESHCFHKHNYD